MKRMFGFLIGILVGSLVGSTIALLLAPESGEELRTQIRSRGELFFELRQRLDTLRAPRVGEYD
jgi:gas vesicle protein